MTKKDAVEMEGAEEIIEGAGKIGAAADIAAAGRESLAEGASDLTRAVDAEIVAGRLADLSGVVAAAGVQDVN